MSERNTPQSERSDPITPATVFVRAEDLVSNRIDDEVVMMHLARGHYYGLDPIGSDIWERLANPTRVDALCAQLLESYDVDPDVCLADVTTLLQQLEAEALVYRVTDGATDSRPRPQSDAP